MMKKKITMAKALLSTCVAASVLSLSAMAEETRRTPRIVGGSVALEGEISWQVSLEDDLGQFCGGSIIGNTWILTAAHCVSDSNPQQQNLAVRIGATDLNSAGGERIAVTHVIVHPGYALGEAADVALLKLANPVGDGATVVALADEYAMSVSGAPGSMALISGWGTTGEDEEPSDELLKVIVPLVSNAVCNGPDAYDGEVLDTEICAGIARGGKDSCYGDSGGPLVLMHEGEWVQAGVVSWGDGCALPNKYGVYARVASFTGWINQAIANGGSLGGYNLGDNTGGSLGGYNLGDNSGGSPGGSSSGSDGGADDANGGETGFGEGNVTLGEHQHLSGLSGAEGDGGTRFTVNVQEDAHLLYISLSGGSGDVDLYVAKDQPPSFNEYFYAYDHESGYNSYNDGNGEFVLVPYPAAGQWHILLDAYYDYRGVEMVIFVH